jgi:hypothetical protein
MYHSQGGDMVAPGVGGFLWFERGVVVAALIKHSIDGSGMTVV